MKFDGSVISFLQGIGLLSVTGKRSRGMSWYLGQSENFLTVAKEVSF